jgi:hypothetical protein
VKATSLRWMLYLAVISLILAGCSGHSKRVISVSISGAPSTVAPNGPAVTVTAAVSNDSSNAGVTWAVTGGGTFTDTATTLTYTPPTSVPENPSVTITATSVTDTTKSASVTFTIVAATLSVTITNPITTIAPGATPVTLNATVANDGSTPGVSWTLVTTGTTTACSPTCGTITLPTTTSVLYTPPATAAAAITASVVATSLSDTTQSATDSFTIQSAVVSTACQASPALRGNEAALTQPIAFLVKGSDSEDAPIAYAGSITPNGSGTLTAADLDIVSFEEELGQQTVDLTASSYSYGSDGRGCLFLAFNAADDTRATHPANRRKLRAHNGPGHTATRSAKTHKRRQFANSLTEDTDQVVFSFALLSLGGAGRIMEFDNTDGSGTVSAGQMHVQTPAAFTLGSLAANFAFGVDGWVIDDEEGDTARVSIAGSFANNGTGGLSNGYADESISFQSPSGPLNGGAGSLNASVSSTTGRGTGSYMASGVAGDFTFDFAYYIVNGSDFYVLSTDDPTSGDAMLSGRALKSAATSAALNGYYITALTGLNCDDCGDAEDDEGNNYVSLSTLNATSALVATGTAYTNDGESSSTTTTPYTGTYTLDTTAGRVAFSNTVSNAVGYLTATADEDDIVAFLVGTDANASGGFVAFQSASQPGYTDDSLSGNYAFGSSEDIAGITGSIVGVFNMNDGGYTMTDDASYFDAPQTPDQTGSGNYTVNEDGSGNFSNTGSDSPFLYLVTNGALVLAMDADAEQPLLYVFIQQPEAAALAKRSAKSTNK